MRCARTTTFTSRTMQQLKEQQRAEYWKQKRLQEKERKKLKKRSKNDGNGDNGDATEKAKDGEHRPTGVY